MDFLSNVLSFIFPSSCGICQKTGNSYLCEKCRRNLENSNIFLNQIDNYCNDNTKYFNYHYYLFSYKSPIREKILQYKFSNKAYLANMFFEFFVKNKKVCGFLKKYDIIISVPISKKKLLKRGYNQSELIAKKMANYIAISMQKNVLKKYKENESQSSLNKKQRFQNVKNVYKIQNKQKIKGKNILLFDDIYTTGATANECAKILKEAGANLVDVLTIAKDLV